MTGRSAENEPSRPGKVYLVGAGPGDPGLITVRGADCLRQADVVFHDRLASEALLDLVPHCAETFYVGKEAGRHSVPQNRINEVLVARAREGKTVVRLKGGDPFVFGRGGEECLALAEAGIPFEVVPGVSAAMGVSAYAGIPLTHRGHASSLALVTAHCTSDESGVRLNREGLTPRVDTLCIYMGMGVLPDIAEELKASGWSSRTPVAVIRWGTFPRQRTVVGTLEDIAGKTEAAGFTPPALVVIGEVVGLRDRLDWFEKRPLFGRRIVVTRWRFQAGELSRRLLELGAEVIHLPAIEIVPPEAWEDLDRAVARLHEYAWIVFSSANGVRFFMERLVDLGHDVRRLGRAKLCAIGEATASVLAEYRLRTDLVPEQYTAESLADALLGSEDLRGKRILLPQGDLSRRQLRERLNDRGASVDAVTAYRTVPPRITDEEIRAVLGEEPVHWITFTSSSTVKNFLTRVKPVMGVDWLRRVRYASIGPVTSETLRAVGETPDVESVVSTIPALVDAILGADLESNPEGCGY